MNRNRGDGRASDKRLFSDLDEEVDRSYEISLRQKLEREQERNLRREWEWEQEQECLASLPTVPHRSYDVRRVDSGGPSRDYAQSGQRPPRRKQTTS